jgi:hypothetical protein
MLRAADVSVSTTRILKRSSSLSRSESAYPFSPIALIAFATSFGPSI